MLPRAAAGERPKDIPMLFACPTCRSRYWTPSRRETCARSHLRPVSLPPPAHWDSRSGLAQFVAPAAPDGTPIPVAEGTIDPLNLGVLSLGLSDCDFTDRPSGGSCDATDWAGTSNWSGEPSFDWSGGGGDSGGSGASGNWD